MLKLRAHNQNRAFLVKLQDLCQGVVLILPTEIMPFNCMVLNLIRAIVDAKFGGNSGLNLRWLESRMCHSVSYIPQFISKLGNLKMN